MKLIIQVLAVLSFSIIANADVKESRLSTEGASTSLSALKQGGMSIGGGFGWSQTKSKQNTNYLTYSIRPSFEYFVIDDLSLGGSINFSESRDDASHQTSLGLGPSVTYYFAKMGATALYLNQRALHTETKLVYDASDSNPGGSINPSALIGTSAIGTKFFLGPQAAFGVGLEYSYDLSNKKEYFDTSISAIGSFSFYY